MATDTDTKPPYGGYPKWRDATPARRGHLILLAVRAGFKTWDAIRQEVGAATNPPVHRAAKVLCAKKLLHVQPGTGFRPYSTITLTDLGKIEARRLAMLEAD